MEKKPIKWNDKYAAGFCRAKNGKITEINEKRDDLGGYKFPYVNTTAGDTVIIYPGDMIIVNGKKVTKVIKKKGND